MQPQDPEQNPFDLKHSQYSLRHWEDLQLQEIFYFG